jgi:hypothetical protein
VSVRRCTTALKQVAHLQPIDGVGIATGLVDLCEPVSQLYNAWSGLVVTGPTAECWAAAQLLLKGPLNDAPDARPVPSAKRRRT